MLLGLARSRRVLFFGGKGGVGKTTIAAASAAARAREGARVLLVSTDPAHSLGHLFDRAVGAGPTKITSGLDAVELDPQATVDAHLKEVSRSLHQLMPANQRQGIDSHMRLSRDAPGMQEAALLERIADTVIDAASEYDLIVFDTAPSGHTARLMALPEMMSAWTEGLLRRREKADRFADYFRGLDGDSSMADKAIGGSEGQTRESRIRQILLRRRTKFSMLRDRLADSQTTSFVIVLTAERLPVLESIELYEQLRDAGITVNCMVVNRRSPLDGGAFLERRRMQEEAHLQTLTRALPDVPRQDVDLMDHDVTGLHPLHRLGALLDRSGQRR